MRLTLVTLLCLFGVLVAIYSLSYSGAFTADDEHLFISGAQSIAQWGQFEAPQVYGNTRFRDEWRDVEPAQPLLGALLVGWGDLQPSGRVHAPLLLNTFVTALTACTVFLATRLRASPRTALIVALLFGFATTAWPYAKTYYRDPLAALLLALAYLGYELARDPARRKTGLLIIVIGIAGGLLAKSTITVAILAFPVAAAIESGHGLLSWPGLKVPLVVAAAFSAIALIASIFIPSNGPLNRFSWPYLSFLVQYFYQAPHTAFGEAMIGAFLSPGKSLFLYSPPLLLAVVSLFSKSQGWRTWLAPWLITFCLVLAQALFYDGSWWGYANWGLRFILPAIPLLAVACAPAIEAYWPRGHWLIVALITVGVLVQIGGVAVNARAYVASLFELAPNHVPQLAVWQFSTSAIFAHWQMLLGGQGVDLASVRILPLNPSPVLLVLVGWLALLAVSAYGLRRAWAGQAGLVPALLIAALLLVLPGLMLRAYARDPLYFSDRRAFAESLHYLDQSVADSDGVLVQAYGQPIWHYFLNNAHLPVRWYSLPVHFPTSDELTQFSATGDAEATLDPATVSLFTRLADSYCRLWLVNAPDAAPESFELERTWLAAHYPVAADREFADESGRVRISTFTLKSPCPPDS